MASGHFLSSCNTVPFKMSASIPGVDDEEHVHAFAKID